VLSEIGGAVLLLALYAFGGIAVGPRAAVLVTRDMKTLASFSVSVCVTSHDTFPLCKCMTVVQFVLC